MCFLIYGEISKNIFFYRTPLVAASEHIFFCHYLKKGVGGYILAGGGWWWMVVDIFWLVVGGGGYILAGGGWW